MSQKFGYDNLDEYKKTSQTKFSLLENGVLDQPSAKLLLINVRRSPSHSRSQLAPPLIFTNQGMNDGLMPIEDSLLLLQHGTSKESR